MPRPGFCPPQRLRFSWEVLEERLSGLSRGVEHWLEMLIEKCFSRDVCTYIRNAHACICINLCIRAHVCAHTYTQTHTRKHIWPTYSYIVEKQDGRVLE